MTSPKGPLLKRLKTDLQDVIKRGYLTEKCVGITEFLGKHKPFIGIMKQRFEDFIVHEIDKDGNTVILENIDKPQDVFATAKEDVDDNLISIGDLKIDPSFKESIDNYVQNNMDTKEYPMLPIDGLDKQQRGLVHLFIKQNYPDLESRTENVGDKKFIKIVPLKQLNNRHKRTMKWPKPDHVHFVLYKENMETAQVVNELSRRLGATTKNFTFAGSKDKRAITTQQFCAYKTNPLKIWQACKDFNFRSHNHVRLHVGHFRFHPEPLRLGDLRGNKFEIVLRNIRLVDRMDTNGGSQPTNQIDFQIVEEALKFAQDHGFINYYGMQRFGSHRIDSHKLGILILRKEFKKLCEEILVEKPIDLRPYQKNNNNNGGGTRKNNSNHHNEISFNEAIRLWRDTRDAAMAYKKMNYKYTIEGSLLRAMTKVDPNDYHGALCIGLARNSRLLYLHAYQSYLWNRIASYRLREFGSQVIVGDLVMIGRQQDLPVDPIDQDDLPVDDLEPEEVGGQEGDGGNHQSDHHQQHNPNIKSNISDDQIKVVTEENIEQFTIFDVVLPIIGGLSKVPENTVKDFIQKLMAEDQVSIEQFQSLGKQWCVNGSYRKLLEKPSDLEWQFIEYADDFKPLVKTDLDRINERQSGGGGQQTDPVDQDDQQPNNNDKSREKIALKIQVTLPSSSYATMFLREITKISSSSLENKPWQRPSTTTTTATLDNDGDDKGTTIADDDHHKRHPEQPMIDARQQQAS